MWPFRFGKVVGSIIFISILSTCVRINVCNALQREEYMGKPNAVTPMVDGDDVRWIFSTHRQLDGSHKTVGTRTSNCNMIQHLGYRVYRVHSGRNVIHGKYSTNNNGYSRTITIVGKK